MAKHKRLLREIGGPLGEAPEGEGGLGRRPKRGRSDGAKGSVGTEPSSEEEGGGPAAGGGMEAGARKRGGRGVRGGERRSERKGIQTPVVSLVDTDEEDSAAHEEPEEEEDSSYEEEGEVQERIPSPKPIPRLLKKSWKTVESESQQQSNSFTRFGFVVTDKTTALTQLAAMPKESLKSKRQKCDSDSDDEEFGSEEKPRKTSKRGRKLKARSSSESLTTIRSNKQTALSVRSKSERGSSKVVSYAEQSEESEGMILSSEDEERKPKRPPQRPTTKKEGSSKSKGTKNSVNAKPQRQKSRKNVSGNEGDQMSQSEEDESGEKDEDDQEDSEDFQYRIEHVLGSKKLTAEEWRKLCENMTTREITRGSVLQQPSEEYYSTSPQLIEKFLIKWTHCSYLHVSWETRGDLESLVGSTARTALNRYYLSQVRGVSTFFEDLRPDEYFPPTVLNIDRVLDADDDSIDIQTIDWENAVLPKNPYFTTSELVEEENSGSVTYLHSAKCFLTVKWENLPYCDCTFEDINDLRRMGVEYESCLRDYFRREQLPPAQNSRRVIKRKIEPEVMQTPPSFKVGELRDYQWDGVRWLLYNWSNKRNSILADEMGLGKTIQTAAFLQILNQHQGLRGPFLIVAPLSTLVNWQREMSSWTTLDSIVYHGSLEDRKLIREHEIYYMTRPKSDGYKVQIVITSPEGCLATDGSNSKTRLLSQIHWDVLIIDEAHRIKNHSSKISTSLREDFSYSNCVLLTGTPLQNNTEELWTLLHFIEPIKFESKDSFIAQFGELKESAQLEQLHQRISPYLLRRVKENVEKSVPPKEEILIEVELTVPQKQYYRALYEGNKAFLFRGALKDGPKLTNLAMELRKCCNHPYLVRGAETELKHYFSEQGKVNDSESPTPTPHQQLLHALIQSSGKLVLLDKLLPKLSADGHRVLIFSQFRIMLDILEDYLSLRKFSYDRIDGGITGRKRQAAIDKFCQPNSNLFVMLLSTRAGGVGINLTPADTVIIYDSDWNPQNDIQAQARAHRIGQTKTVKVYRLLTRKSYEMRMFEVASRKLGLDYAVMHNMKGAHSSANKSTSSTVSFTSKELELLLRQGAYDIFREEKDGSGDLESKKFCEEDINQILSRSTVIVHDDAEKKQHPSANFSKASFVQTGSECNVDVNDPDFWSKVVGLTLVEEVEENTRRRKCKDAVTNYLQGKPDEDESNDSNFELEEEPTDSKPKRAPKGKKRDLKTIVPATWNLSTMNALSQALQSCGYLNWERIRVVSKLPFSLDDIASGCRILVLYYIRTTCLVDVTQIPPNSSNVDCLLAALMKFNLSTFCRFVLLSYRIELLRKNELSVPTDGTLSIEDELILGFYQNPSPNIFDHYVPSKHSEWTNEPIFHDLYQLMTFVPLPPGYATVSQVALDMKLRNSIKSKLGLLETHFEIAHAMRLEQLRIREKLLNSTGSERYPGFDPFESSLEEFLKTLLVEDSPTEWWVTGADDLLLMAGVNEFGFPTHQSSIASLEEFLMKQDPGPLHRKPITCSDEFLVGGSGYSLTPSTTLEHLERGRLHLRIQDIAALLRSRSSPPAGHFYSYLLKATGLYGWPTNVISQLAVNQGKTSSAEVLVAIRPQYLPNWTELAIITGAKIVRKQFLADSCHRLSSILPPSKSMNAHLLKSNHMNSVKIFLSLHTDDQIIQILSSSSDVPYGPTCSSAPLWWTPQHDLKFLKLLVKYGPQWKVILEDAEAADLPHSLLEPDPTFIVPTRAPESKVVSMMDSTRLSTRFNLLVASLQQGKKSLTFVRASSSSNGSSTLAHSAPDLLSGNPIRTTSPIPSSTVVPQPPSVIFDLTDSIAQPESSPPIKDPTSDSMIQPQSSSVPSSTLAKDPTPPSLQPLSTPPSKTAPGSSSKTTPASRSIMSFFQKK